MKGIVTLDKAKEIFKMEYPDERIISVKEYDDCYVFDSYPKGVDVEKAKMLIRNPTAVEKSTGRTFAFNPLMYKRLKEKANGSKSSSNDIEKYVDKGWAYLNERGDV